MKTSTIIQSLFLLACNVSTVSAQNIQKVLRGSSFQTQIENYVKDNEQQQCYNIGHSCSDSSPCCSGFECIKYQQYQFCWFPGESMYEVEMVQESKSFETQMENYAKDNEQQQCNGFGHICSDSSPCCPGYECVTDQQQYQYCWFTRESMDEIEMAQEVKMQDGSSFQKQIENYVKDNEQQQCNSFGQICSDSSPCCPGYECVTDQQQYQYCWFTRESMDEVEMAQEDEVQERKEELVEYHCPAIGDPCSRNFPCCSPLICDPFTRQCVSRPFG